MTEAPQRIKSIVEAAIFAAGKPLNIEQLLDLFEDNESVTRDQLRSVLAELEEDYAKRAVNLKKVASGYRFQVISEYSSWVSRLWTERPARYSRALLETLAIIAYKQPLTRAEIEDIRGVSVSSAIMKTLQDRSWVKVMGHRDVPGRPAVYATTRQFLDYFNLTTLSELPTLEEIRDITEIMPELDLPDPLPIADRPQEGESTSEENSP